jgi:hypothetical protein
MPATNFPEYAREIEDVLDAIVATGEAVVVSLQIDQRSSLRGFIAGLVQFSDASESHFREFVDIGLPEPRLTYAYHYQGADNDLIFHYDNAAHHPRLPQAEHKHTPAGVEASPAPLIAQVVDEILTGAQRLT